MTFALATEALHVTENTQVQRKSPRIPAVTVSDLKKAIRLSDWNVNITFTFNNLEAIRTWCVLWEEESLKPFLPPLKLGGRCLLGEERWRRRGDCSHCSDFIQRYCIQAPAAEQRSAVNSVSVILSHFNASEDAGVCCWRPWMRPYSSCRIYRMFKSQNYLWSQSF